MSKAFVTALAVAGMAAAANGAISFTGTTYTQNFDTLATTGTANAWANDSTLSGWSLFRGPVSGPVAIATYAAGTGSSNAGAFYSFGLAGDRAFGGAASGAAYFGSPATGSVAGWLAISFTNNTAGSLSEFTLGFDGEQWRNGGNATAQSMVLEYGFGATFETVSSWNAPGGAFNFTSPVVGTTGAAVDGNVAGLVAGLGGTVSSLNWNVGDTLWFRWIENNDAGNDHGLAIDNLSFIATPAPGSIALLGLAGLVAGRRKR